MYNAFYNLNERPFDLKADLKYFYTSRSHKQAIEHLRVGFGQPDGVLILTGGKGLGKTTLISYLLDKLDENSNVVGFIRKPPQKDRDFLPAILTALQIPITEQQPKALFDALHMFTREQARLNKKVLLVVDDAESLSHNCLEFLCLMSTSRLNEHGSLQIVLVGTNKLEMTLAAIENQSFRRKVIMSYDMQPLSISDTREYIQNYLKVAGWNGAPVIDEDVFVSIHELTAGVPYAINQYCDRLLVLGMMRKTHHISNNDVSNLTSATIEKLETVEIETPQREERKESPRLDFEYSFSPRPELQNAEPFQKSVGGVDMDNIVFDAPTKINRKAVISVVAACLVVSASAYIFDKMYANNAPATTSVAHSAANNHASPVHDHSSVDEASASHSESGMKTTRYTLNTMSAESGDEAKLDIQQLLRRSYTSGSEMSGVQSDGSKDTEAWRVDASGIPVSSASSDKYAVY